MLTVIPVETECNKPNNDVIDADGGSYGGTLYVDSTYCDA